MTIHFRHNDLGAKLKKFEEIAFAYILGSSEKGVVKDGSDIDIAIYFVDREKDIELRTEIIAELEQIIDSFSNYDLVILNSANSVLSMQALQGKLLFVKPEFEDLHAEFYSSTCRQYEDDMFWMKQQLKYRGYEIQWNN